MPGGGHLDPFLEKYMADQRRQYFFELLTKAGQGIIAANRRGESPIRGLSAGLSQGSPPSMDLIEMLKAQDVLSKYRTGQRQDYARGALATGRRPAGLDPISGRGIPWKTPRQPSTGLLMADEPAALGGQPGQQQPALTSEQLARLQPPAGLLGRQGFGGPTERRGLLSEAYPEAVGRAQVAEEFGAAKAPQTRTVKRGKEFVTEEWRAGKGWTEVGRGPRFSPKESGGLSLPQQANNAEIDQARATLDRMRLDKAEILRRTQKATNTGRANPNYDPSIERIVRLATQRKTGDDRDYRRYFGTYLGGVELSDPAGMRPLPPGVSAEEPNIFERGLSLLGFGGDTSPAGAKPFVPGAVKPFVPRRRPLPAGTGNEGPITPRPGSNAGVGSALGAGREPVPSSGVNYPTHPRGYSGKRPGGPKSAKSIETMSEAEITEFVYGGRRLTQSELNRIDARLKALGR